MPVFSARTPSSSFIAFFFIAWNDFEDLRRHEIKVHMGDLVGGIDTIFINPASIRKNC